ncbi:MAG: hypothetical protein QME40_06335 [bacterium]|nr:hypothetical protein [bacterium]
MIEEHINYHNRYPEENKAVLGYVTWHPDLDVTPFMWWLENGGPQFSFNTIIEEKKEDCEIFYTSNISLKHQFLLSNRLLFDEDFLYASHEDTEFWYRLKELNLKVIYNPNAVGYHMHQVVMSEYCRNRQIKEGISRILLYTKNFRFRQYFEVDIGYHEGVFCSEYLLQDMENLLEFVEKAELFLYMDSFKRYFFYELLVNFYSQKGALIKLKEIIPSFDFIKEKCFKAIKAKKRERLRRHD